MGQDSDPGPPPEPLPAALLKFGQRNLLYIGFVTLLGPLGLALEGPRPVGAQGLGAQGMDGLAFALMMCALVSLVFFLINAGLVVFDLTKGRRIAKALIGCALPAVFGVGSLLIR